MLALNYDTQCGAKIMCAEHLDESFDEPFDTAWLFDVEILCRFQAFQPDLAIDDWAVEVPLSAWRDEGDSRVATSDFLKAPWQLAKIRRRYDRGSVIAQSRESTRQSRLGPTIQGWASPQTAEDDELAMSSAIAMTEAEPW